MNSSLKQPKRGGAKSDHRKGPNQVDETITVLVFPVVLPQEKMLPENFVCFGPKSDVDRDEILSSVSTFLQDTYPGW